jgi:glycosyltransferase involved in cell wall biosynthesis
MIGFEENEISQHSNGGTELSKRSLAKYIPEELSNEFQIIASRVRELNQEKIRVYWQHDLPQDPEISHLKNESSRSRFHKFVFVSNWQLNEYINELKFPRDIRTTVIENPIDIFPKVEKNFDKIRLVYFSTPQRGLELLVPVFTELAKKHDNIHLDVYSGFSIYGWPQADEQFEPLYEAVRNHPQMTYHGVVPHEELRNAISQSHILAYPSIWKETSCRVLMESMSAGLICVHPNYGALCETSAGLTSMYQFQDNTNAHASVFYQYLEHSIGIVKNEDTQNYLKFVKAYADQRYSIERIGNQWKYLLDELLDKYPDTKSRAFEQKQMFVYKTT